MRLIFIDNIGKCVWLTALGISKFRGPERIDRLECFPFKYHCNEKEEKDLDKPGDQECQRESMLDRHRRGTVFFDSGIWPKYLREPEFRAVPLAIMTSNVTGYCV